MKKISILLALFLCLKGLNAQITFDASYNGVDVTPVKFQTAGHKYMVRTGAQIDLYNINHSLFKSMTIPQASLSGTQFMGHISDNLFNTDNLVEYAVTTSSYTSSPPMFRYKTYIFNENGNLLLLVDSASLLPGDGIFFNGVQAKMKLSIRGGANNTLFRTEIYTLPGSIPCTQCSPSGTISGISSESGQGNENATFYPNPVTDQLKLNYTLPPGHKTAEIKIYDLQGKLIEEFKVTDTFDFIYLPSDYSNGLYLYCLVVDGKKIKTEKIILNK